jgi:hypothetical protein
MPPRFAYWTLLIDNSPTAFRAAEPDDLLPTLYQLRRTNANVVMKWFAHGRLWDSSEEAQRARRQPSLQAPRGKDWRPGGEHRDPRARPKPPKRERRQRDRVRPAVGRAREADRTGRAERPAPARREAKPVDRPASARREAKPVHRPAPARREAGRVHRPAPVRADRPFGSNAPRGDRFTPQRAPSGHRPDGGRRGRTGPPRKPPRR